MDLGTCLDRLIRHVKPKNSAGRQKVAALASCLMLQPVGEKDVQERQALYKKWGAIVTALRQVPEVEQRSDEWYATRWNLITASDLAQCLGAGKFGTQADFFKKKCDEASSRAALPNAPPLVWGSKFEPVANAIYQRRLGVVVHEFGLLKHPTRAFIGASPDGITEEGIMVEIKCPWRRKIKPGEVPEQYYYQVQSQLDVCDLEECDFFECAFREHYDQDEFVQAMEVPPDAERGVIIEMPGYKYRYSDIACQDRGELIAWKDAQLADAPEGSKATYWWLELMQIQRVRRDKAWIDAKYDAASVVWDTVLRYRAEGGPPPSAPKRTPRTAKGDGEDDASSCTTFGAAGGCLLDSD